MLSDKSTDLNLSRKSILTSTDSTDKDICDADVPYLNLYFDLSI